ncbi:hypothetical protein DRJ58_04955 [Candidatus Acetothermia bacterium]|nr:MAG: hypothetical protein DRJ58_04955 [Candidatus Acetothermia bacterium]
MKMPFCVGVFLLSVSFLALGVEGVTVSLSPVPAHELGPWAAGKAVFRLYPSLERPLKRQGPEPAMSLFGVLKLGGDEYPLMFAVLTDNTPYLAVDLDGDGVLSATEGRRGSPVSEEEWLWHLSFTVHGRPYELSIVWPAGRGFLFLIGQTPMKGELKLDGKAYTIVLVDADVNGNYNDEADFYVVDVDGDGVLHGDEGEHEVFSLEEPFTIGETSFRLAEVSPDGSTVRVVPTEYVPPKVPLYIGAEAPDFSFESLQGEEISLSQYRGKVVLLDFWASWCLPCVVAMPKMKSLYEAYHDEGLEIIGINLDLSREQALDFVQHFELPWPQYWDGKGYDSELAVLFRVKAIPMLYLIDQQGIIRGKWLGLAEEEVKSTIEELLGLDLEEGNREKEQGEAVISPRPILSLRVSPRLSLSATYTGEVPLNLKLRNTSSYEAKDLKVSLERVPEGVSVETVTVESLKPGESTDVTLSLSVQDLEPGEYPLTVGVTYNYCPNEETCFKIDQDASLLLVVSAPAGSTSNKAASGMPEASAGKGIPWIIFAGAGVLLVLLLFVLFG